jgi:hypothetical protein
MSDDMKTVLDNIKTEEDAKRAGLPVFKFNIDAASMKAFKNAETGKRTVTLDASSDADDLVGDAMSSKALSKMESAAPNTTVFLNHKYTVPEDVFGIVRKAKLIKSAAVGNVVNRGEMTVLRFEVDVAESNERAVKTHDLMLEGNSQLGSSVTVLILDKSDRKDGGRVIEDVYYLEVSVVGIPCNRQSWVAAASKALEAIETDTPKTPAPTTKEAPASDLPAAETTTATETEDKPAAAPVSTPNVLSTESESGRALIRQSVADLVEEALENRRAEMAAHNLSGSARLPLAGLDTPWSPSDARKHLQGKRTDTQKVEKPGFNFKRGHMFFDPDAADKPDGYRLVFADVVDGEQKAVPRAIFALAGLVQKADSGISEDDRAVLRGRIESYYTRMAKEFGDDKIVAPWNRDAGVVDGASLVHGTLLARSLAFDGVAISLCPDCTAKGTVHTVSEMRVCSTCSKEWPEDQLIASKGMYLDELDSRGLPSWFLWDVFMDCVYDLWWAAYDADDAMKALLMAELTVAIDEFAAVLKVNAPKWMGLYEKPEEGAETEAKSGFKASAANLPMGVSKLLETVSKIGARNSSSDLRLIENIHSASVSLGATCGEAKSFEVTTEQKEFLTQIIALANTSEKTAPLATALTALADGQGVTTPDVTNKALIEQLEAAQDALTKTLEEIGTTKSALETSRKDVADVTVDRDKWKTVCEVGVRALEAVGNLPLPRIGAGVQ